MNNIILLATYWNEIEWIKASLAQIDKIDPIEIIICDGCFDPSQPNFSSDGTRKVIESYVASKGNARMISALRLSHFGHLLNWLQPLPHERIPFFSIPKLRAAKSFMYRNLYRLNQMATFNYMLRLSRTLRPGMWFMTYDCDQFYSDEMLRSFKLVNEQILENMLVGKEFTFFDAFDRYTENFETRDYNNMPHRLFNDTRFIPTRHPARVIDGQYKVYTEFETKKHLGIMYHYHIKSQERRAAGFSLGDRRFPEKSRTSTKPYLGEHPSIVREFFLS